MAASQDLRIGNVSLIGRGVAEHGFVTLRKHHVVFSFTPTAKPDESGAPTKDTTTKPKSKIRDVYVPYPLINSCVLKPSTSQTSHPYPFGNNATARDEADTDGSMFPPSYGTNADTRPSTESARLAPYSSPNRPVSPAHGRGAASLASTGREPSIRIRRRDFSMMAFHFHGDDTRTADEAAREMFYCLKERCCITRAQDMYAFHFKRPQQEDSADLVTYDARREFARMGVGDKSAEGPGSSWRITDINHDYAFSPTYPRILCVPRAVSNNMLKYGGPYRSKSRIPALTYLHSNGGSITRSSQPMPGIGGKRNPQDERLVSAIFSSHSPARSPQQEPAQGDTETAGSASNGEQRAVPALSLSQSDSALDEKFIEQERIPKSKIYGSTRKNVIVDARPRINALANRATGGGIEDVSNYCGAGGETPERVFLNIANIHVMRKSLDKVIESFGSADYTDLRPNQELLRKSGWLSHISGLLDGAEMIARVVGLGGSHVLLHCSDGWDRTSQVAALAEIMLDPHYRTLTGFATLVQKDFFSFGHKFGDRHGILGCENWFEIENDRVTPSQSRDSSTTETSGVNNFGSKALSGARSWFEKNRNGLFRQQNDSRRSLDGVGSRPPSPPPNPVLHSPASSNSAKDRGHKVKEDEIAPIFHQFLDAVFQLQSQFPESFEFNERFLKRVFYHAHAGQYGEFLFNNERERSACADKFPSVWPHFLSRKAEFANPQFVGKVNDPLLFPQRDSAGNLIGVRWWNGLFGRKEEEMNTPHALATADMETYSNHFEVSGPTAKLSLDDSAWQDSHTGSTSTSSSGLLNGQSQTETRSDPQQQTDIDQAPRPILQQRETTDQVLERYIQDGKMEPLETKQSHALGVSSQHQSSRVTGGGLDFAAFARGSAFSER